METNRHSEFVDRDDPSGIVLLITLVLLVALSTVGYILSSRIAVQRHRDNFIIDYQAARYGCDSALKYALATLEGPNAPELISRPNEPDFSDLFNLDELEYRKLIESWEAQRGIKKKEVPREVDDTNDINDTNDANDIGRRRKSSDFNDANEIFDFNNMQKDGNIPDVGEGNDVNSFVVRGPYGPPWPYIIEPVELEIGSVKVKIEIEDENAKYPLGWMVLEDEQVKREAESGLTTFLEWMGLGKEVDSLEQQLEDVAKQKRFKVDFAPIQKSSTVQAAPSRRGRRRSGGAQTQPPPQIETISVSQQVTEQTVDFARLFHSSLVDTESLARPTIVSEERKESALKYMGLWGSRKVNINTAPRHVLEAAFAFGGDAEKIADQIIQRRRTEPFKDIADLRKTLLRYTASIDKSEKYITTTSDLFIVKVTAVSGAAKASAVVAVLKDQAGAKRVGMISG
jgi:hypothetical protein